MPVRKKKKKVKGKSTERTNERYIVTLFADIVGCSEISNNKKLREYNKFLSDFQDCFEKVCEHYKKERYEETEYPYFKWGVRGDEGCLMIFVSKNDSSLAKDIDIAIKIACDLKRVWLFTENNIHRIRDDGLLPVDVAIGIHAGKVWINKDGPDKYRPEGYAINLAKRIESASRDGKFTHILLSEAARGQLHNLKDEDTYIFDDPFPIEPKGISRNVRVFEIKHHFLRTNWDEEPSEASILYNDLDDNKIGILEMAYKANPTNLWLAEDYIWFVIMRGYSKLCREGKEEDREALEEEYAPALEVARRTANSDLRDAGTLAILGFIEGEQRRFEEELKRYKEALKLPGQHGNIPWYKALAMSYKLYSDVPKKKAKIKDFFAEREAEIIETLESYDRALELKPFNPWIAYDYACELSWWSQANKNFRKPAINMLIKAFGLNSETKGEARDEDYLKPITDDPDVEKYLK